MAAALHSSWATRVGGYLERADMQALAAFLRAEKAAGKRIHPPGRQMFAALDAVPFDAVRVVILGQDPYHGPGQAHGLSFSVPPGIAIPPSLLNIFKEIERDLGLPMPRHGCLQHWASQGVLLLNAVLSVEEGRAGSHAGKGWEPVTDACVRAVAARAEPSVFMLWGSHAQAKAARVPEIGAQGHHLVITSPHPSPLSAHRGFFGSRPFSQANAFLEATGRGTIDWRL